MSIGPTDRPAAVFAVFVDREETRLLLIRRAKQPTDPWSGQIALPGGHIEPGDANPSETAYRETAEEVSIGKESIRLLGELGAFATQIPKVKVHVFVGVWDGVATPQPDPAEVASVFEVPVCQLLERHYGEGFQDQLPNELGRALTYPSDHGTIWGVTARILHHLLGLIGPPPTPGER
ncbi:MAG: CoA pyrophosphatase [Planctomycetota bacterium]